MNNTLAYKDEYLKEELIDGQVVLMSPRPAINHITVANNISAFFTIYLKGKKCRIFPDGTDLYLTEKDRFIPDVMIVCDPEKIKYNGIYGAPDLVVEVLSPSTAKRDKSYKKQVYEQCGVREYWLVSPNEKSVEQYLLTEGRLELAEVYTLPADYLTDEEKEPYLTEFKCSLYDDLLIKLEDIFEYV